MTRRHRTRRGDTACWLYSLCCDDNRIYCIQHLEAQRKHQLAVYNMRVPSDGILKPLDKVDVGHVSGDCRPCVDSSHRVYVPCGRSGVRVYCYQDGRLLPARDPLRCVGYAMSICVNTADTVFVGDLDTRSVCLVNVPMDTVIRRLERPPQVTGYPGNVSVVGQTVLVCYDNNTLVTYHSDSLTPGKVLQTPERVAEVSRITTDGHYSFIVTNRDSVYVFDDNLLWHRIHTGSAGLRDCAVVQSQLWLVYRDGAIAVLTPQ